MALCEPWSDTISCGECSDYALDATLVEENLLAASEILYLLSAQQFPGECVIEDYRPCSSSPGLFGVPTSLLAFTPITNGWYDRAALAGCSCGSWDTCSCPPLSQVNILLQPVVSIEEVRVDGAVVSPSDYRLDPPSSLVSLTDRKWPCCQSMRLPASEAAFSINFTWGRLPPYIGVKAAQILACELYMACDPEAFDGQCRLPRNITSVARQGVAITKAVTELFTPQKGKPVAFGIPEIDLFLSTVNPHGLYAPSVFLSPDDPSMARLIGT